MHILTRTVVVGFLLAALAAGCDSPGNTEGTKETVKINEPPNKKAPGGKDMPKTPSPPKPPG
jgi:hypothetical protein